MIKDFFIKLLGGFTQTDLDHKVEREHLRVKYAEENLEEHKKKVGTVIDERNIFFDVPCMDKNGDPIVEHCVDEDNALAVLLADNVLFCNERPTSFDGKNVDPDSSTTVLYVNCNDLFYWACADAENLPNNEIGNLYKLHKANSKWGSSKWCCLRRKLRPQVPIVDTMKKDGYWDAELEALPEP